MALPLTGQISLNQIKKELLAGTDGTVSSLVTASTGGYKTLESSTQYKPDGSAPHSMSEFRGYSQLVVPTYYTYSVRSGNWGCSAQSGTITITSPVSRTVYSNSASLQVGSILCTDTTLTTRIPWTFIERISANVYYTITNGEITETYLFGSPC